MSDIVLKVEDLYKKYRLGVLSTGTLSHDLNRWWAKVQGKEDPTLKVGENNREIADDTKFVWALEDINFEVKRGEVLGIIGKNGAGKSTLLKILSKVTSPTQGGVKIKGRIASLLEVGTGFHPELTGRENIFLNGAILGMRRPEIKRKLDEIIEFAGVAKYVDTPVKRYSSGMYVRLAFAVAAHLEPEILIIDEVLAVGDAEFQKKCLGKMKDVAGEGRTVLFVSHNMGAVNDLCTHLIRLSRGKLIADSKEIKKIIGEYLLGDNFGSGELQSFWQDHSGQKYKNEIHNIKLFALTDDEGQVLPNIITHNTEIWLNIQGEVFQEEVALNIGYVVYNEQGDILFWSWYKTLETITQEPFKKGNFNLKSKIPKSFLNEGNYRVEVISVLHNVKNLIEKGSGVILNFNIEGGFKNILFNPTMVWENNL